MLLKLRIYMLSTSFKAIAVLVLICFELMLIYQLFNLYSTYSVWFKIIVLSICSSYHIHKIINCRIVDTENENLPRVTLLTGVLVVTMTQ